LNEDEIKNNPSLKKLREDAESIRRLKGVWPILKPFARLLGAEASRTDEALDRAVGAAYQVDELIAIPDKFNSMFSDRGWILFDSMELEVAKQAIQIAERDGIDRADAFLVEHFSPDWVRARLGWLSHLKGFRERFELAEAALEDYRTGRFYSSVLVTLSLIDGWVSELNIIDFQRHGFFSEKTRLVAWDSISAHPKGLVKLQEVFGRSRMMTRTEAISIPYRHGIMHGMDLGYNNRRVAAKCWAALFAVRDWAIKAAREELGPPELEPEVERTLWESIERYREVREETERLRQWQPRKVVVGESIPATGQTQDYPPGSPEQKAVEFLNYWLTDNYGYMASCYAPILQTQPVDVRNRFEHKQLLAFKIMEVNEVTAAVADVKVELELKVNNDVSSSVYEFRLVASSNEGDFADIESEDTIWGITTWRIAQ
jgi:hypothetical protein